MNAPAITGGRNCFAHFRADARAHDPLNAYLLSLASTWVYPFIVADCTGCEESDIPSLFRARVRHWGLGESVRLISRSAFGRFDTQTAVVAGHGLALVIFRGSEHPVKVASRFVNALRDWLVTDADIAVETVTDLGPEVDVHRGFFRAFKAVADDIERALQGPLADGCALWITGHSMGGALATLAVPWLCARGLRVGGAYTFGAPMVGGIRLTNLFRSLPVEGFHRYVLEGDPVPGLPPEPATYEHVVPPHVIHSDGSVVLAEKAWKGRPSFSQHPPAEYCSALHRALTDEQRRLVPPPPA